MKKAIILSGPQASGKSWTAMAIATGYENESYTGLPPDDIRHHEVIFICQSSPLMIIDSIKFVTKVCIIEDCIKSLLQIEGFDRVRKMYPECLFIFTTRTKIVSKEVDFKKYQLIICNYHYSLEEPASKNNIIKEGMAV